MGTLTIHGRRFEAVEVAYECEDGTVGWAVAVVDAIGPLHYVGPNRDGDLTCDCGAGAACPHMAAARATIDGAGEWPF